MPYEVQTNTAAHGWINDWLYDEGDGITHAETFETFAEAQAALDEFFAEHRDEVMLGHWPPEQPEDYRIVFAFDAPASQLRPLTSGA